MSEGASDGARLETVAVRRPQKSEAAFRTISEVSEDLDVPQHVLRFWESRFQTIKPLKRGGGRRYYRPEDVQLLRRIRDLLYKDGYTIRGVQKLLREQARGNALGGLVDEADAAPAPRPAAALSAPQSVAPPLAPSAPVAVAPPAPERPAAAAAQSAAAPSVGGVTGARRVLIETLLSEIDELRKQLGDAVKKPRK